jgi:hypothetical protein
MEDAGYYKCTMTFAHRGREYNVTRNIELLIKSKYLPRGTYPFWFNSKCDKNKFSVTLKPLDGLKGKGKWIHQLF